MPGRDGTGPRGYGSKTGQGLGLCTGVGLRTSGAFRLGKGRRCRPGLGTADSCGKAINSAETRKDLLQEQKSSLQRRLEVIDKHLERL